MAKRKFDDTNFSTNEDQKISYLTLDDRTCTRCGTVTNKIDSNIKEFNWAKQLQCPKCNEIWTICVVCTYRGGRMKNLRSVLSHHYYCHNVKRVRVRSSILRSTKSEFLFLDGLFSSIS